MNSARGFRWPNPPLQVVLYEPDIPPNTGNIARLCAGVGSPLHLIEPLGFRLTDAALRRAGLDYWEAVEIYRHKNFEEYLAKEKPQRCFYLSTKGTRLYTDVHYQPGDALVFGSETRGLPQPLLEDNCERVLTIPMRPGQVRSLNLSNSVSIVLYEALRQIDLRGG